MNKNIEKLIIENFHRVSKQLGMITENEQYMNRALETLQKVGSFNKLTDLDKLILLGPSKDMNQLKRLDLIKIFRENGGTFGQRNIMVMIKPNGEQPVDHEFSKNMAGKTGWLSPYIFYGGAHDPYITVTFDNLIRHNSHGDTSYESMPIAVSNLIPLAYGDDPDQFVQHNTKMDYERREILKQFGIDPDNPMF